MKDFSCAYYLVGCFELFLIQRKKNQDVEGGGVVLTSQYLFQSCTVLHQYSSVQNSSMLIDQFLLGNVWFKKHAVHLTFSVAGLSSKSQSRVCPAGLHDCLGTVVSYHGSAPQVKVYRWIISTGFGKIK